MVFCGGLARDGMARRLEPAYDGGHEDRHVQHQQCQPPPAEPAAMAARSQTRHRLPAGAEGRRPRFSAARHRPGRLRRGLARPEDLERRRHPGAQGRAGADPHANCPAIATTRRRAISKPPSKASSSPASTCRTAIRSPARNSTTSSPGSSGCGARREIPEAGIPVVLAGDYNVAPTELDIYPTRSWDKDALIQPKAARRSSRWLEAGLARRDPRRCIRKADFTFWDYKRNRWPRDAGLRLDHLLLSPALPPRLIKAGVDRSVRGEEGASDHAPAWVELRDGAARNKAPLRVASSLRGAKATKQSRAVAPPGLLRGARHRAGHFGPDPVARRDTKSARRPLLVIDGDSFAHRAYHALPKNIRRDRGRPAGAILGFANHAVAALARRKAARGAGRLGHARGADLSP